MISWGKGNWGQHLGNGQFWAVLGDGTRVEVQLRGLMGCVKKRALYSSKESCNIHLGCCHSPGVCREFGKYWNKGGGDSVFFLVLLGTEL